MSKNTNVTFFADDLGKKVYRKKVYYTLVVEQDVLASNQDEADEKFLEGGGIDYDAVSTSLTSEREGVETYYVDANFQESGDTELVGKVVYEDDEYAEEDGMVELDPYATEED